MSQHTGDSRIIGDLVQALYGLDTVPERFHIYQQTVCNLGFDAVCYSFEPKSSFNPDLKRPPVFEVSPRFPLNFLQDYKKNGWFQDDFTIREICEGKLQAKDWKQKEQSTQLKEREKHLIRVAREQYGIKNAISIPTMKHLVGLAGASIISFQDDASFAALKRDHLTTLTACTQVFNDIIMQQPAQLVKTFVFDKLPKITPKERIVLRELLSGVPLKQLGEASGINPNAAKNHLARLRQKFEVNKTEQLKYKLETLNMMDYL